MEICFNSTSGKYELNLPDDVITVLHLKDEESACPLKPVHVDKFRLERLGREIETTYLEIRQCRDAFEKRHARNKRIFVISLFVMGVVIAVWRRNISKYCEMPYWMVPVYGFMILLSFNRGYFRTSLELREPNVSIPFLGVGTEKNPALLDSLELLNLRKIIEEDFS